MGLEVTGLDELMKKLRRIKNNSDAILLQALMQGGKMIQATAKELCPVDTGQLKNSIVVESIPGGVRIGSNLEYAAAVEYGSGPVGKEANPDGDYRTTGWSFMDPKTGKRIYTRGHAPMPFLYPAFRVNEERVRKHVKDVLIRMINEG